MQKALKQLIGWDNSEELSTDRRAIVAFRHQLKKILVSLHPHIAIRYMPVIDYLNSQAAMSSGPISVLEVGSGSLGVTRFWRHPATGVDVEFHGPNLGYLKQVKASALQLPFKDRDFDCVISIDMLEHLSKADRDKALGEMLRVATKAVIVALPCDDNALEAEDKAWHDYQGLIETCRNEARKKELLKRSFFLQEHKDQELPKEDEVLSLIHGNLLQKKITAKISTLDNESIWVWNFLLPSVIPYNRFKALVVKVLALVFLPLLGRVGWGGFYRKFFFINIERDQQEDP